MFKVISITQIKLLRTGKYILFSINFLCYEKKMPFILGDFQCDTHVHIDL